MNESQNPLLCLTDVRWREVGDDGLDEHHWPYNQSCPAEGEVRWGDTTGYLDPLRIGQKRWMLYVPINAHLNGFDDSNPHDLDECAIIEVELLQVLLPRVAYHGAQSYIGIQCRCLQVLPLARIADVFAPTPAPLQRATSLLSTQGAEVTYLKERWSEVHEWYFVTNPATMPDGLSRLVLWGVDIDG